MIKTNRSGFKSITLKIANMRSEQDFTVYPYDGGDHLIIQSTKRICRINLRTGVSVINKKNEQGGAYFFHLNFDTIMFNFDEDILNTIKSNLWENDGVDGGGNTISWENKKLYENRG